MSFIISRWKNLNRGLQRLIVLGVVVAIGIGILIALVNNPKPAYLAMFWYEIIFLPILGIHYIKKGTYCKKTLKAKIFLITAFSGIYIFLCGPMLMDIPNLLMGQYESVKGQPKRVWNEWFLKVPIKEHVTVDGKAIIFFISSNMSDNLQKKYYIEYLPHSKYAIDIKEITD